MRNAFQVEALTVQVYDSAEQLAAAAAELMLNQVRSALAQGSARIVFATGNSQRATLQRLRQAGLDWSQVTGFHLDEYLGLADDHPASFRRYLQEQVVEPLGLPFHWLNGEALEPIAECDRYAQLLRAAPLDLCLLGIGDNGHLAFNDPAVARLSDSRWVKLVQLDKQNRQQQLATGPFTALAQVPRYAYTLTLPAIFSARKLLCLAPGARKAPGVLRLLTGEVKATYPAAFLRTQPQATLMIDAAAAALIETT